MKYEYMLIGRVQQSFCVFCLVYLDLCMYSPSGASPVGLHCRQKTNTRFSILSS